MKMSDRINSYKDNPASSRQVKDMAEIRFNSKNANERLFMFKSFWPKKSKFKDIKSLAEQALYCIGSDDICECAYCGVLLGDWKEIDDPKIRHQQLSPNCRFINGKVTGDIPLSSEDEGAAASHVDSTQTILQGNDHSRQSAYWENGNTQEGEVRGKYLTKATCEHGDAEALLDNGTNAGTSEGVVAVNKEGVFQTTSEFLGTESSIPVENKAQPLDLSGNIRSTSVLVPMLVTIPGEELQSDLESTSTLGDETEEINPILPVATEERSQRRENAFEEASAVLTKEEEKSNSEPTKSPENGCKEIDPNISYSVSDWAAQARDYDQKQLEVAALLANDAEVIEPDSSAATSIEERREVDLVQLSATLTRDEERNNLEQTATLANDIEEMDLVVQVATYTKTSKSTSDLAPMSAIVPGEEQQNDMESTSTLGNEAEEIERNIPVATSTETTEEKSLRRNDSQVTVTSVGYDDPSISELAMQFDDAEGSQLNTLAATFPESVHSFPDSLHQIPTVFEDQRLAQFLLTYNEPNTAPNIPNGAFGSTIFINSDEQLNNTLRDDVNFGAREEPLVNNILRDDFNFGAREEPPPLFDVEEPSEMTEGDKDMERTAAYSSNDEDRSEPNRSATIEERLQQLEHDQRCKVCLDNEKNVVLQPCMHLCVCKECAKRLAKCPICRRTICERKSVFMA